VPLRQVRLAAALSTGISGWNRHPVHFHTGSVSRDSVPLRQVRLAAALSTGISGWNRHLVHFHNGSVSRDSVPLRQAVESGSGRA